MYTQQRARLLPIHEMLRSTFHLFVVLLLIFHVVVAVDSSSCDIDTMYQGVSVIGLKFADENSAQSVKAALEEICELRTVRDEASYKSNEFVEYLLTTAQLKRAQGMLPRSSIRVFVGDLGAMIAHEAEKEIETVQQDRETCTLDDDEEEEGSCAAAKSLVAGEMDTDYYKKYHTYDDLVKRWKLIAHTYKEYVRLETIGKTVEGRPIHMFRIGNTDEESPKRVLFNAMQHAREWITTMSVLYTVEKLAVDAEKAKSWYSDVQLLVVPMSNPDGYVYSHEKDRMWRKNRSPSTPCRRRRSRTGVDLNRNWATDFAGGESTSSDPCSDIYTGPKPFSEPETQALRDLVKKTKGLAAHIDVHSFSQLVLGRWSYSDELPPNVEEVRNVGNLLTEKLSGGGKKYQFARGKTNLIYLASGVMPDWVYEQGVLSYTFELRPKQMWQGGFLLPARQIIPNSKEFFEAASALMDYVAN